MESEYRYIIEVKIAKDLRRIKVDNSSKYGRTLVYETLKGSRGKSMYYSGLFTDDYYGWTFDKYKCKFYKSPRIAENILIKHLKYIRERGVYRKKDIFNPDTDLSEIIIRKVKLEMKNGFRF